MHAAIQFSLFWALAFVTLCAAVALLNLFYGLIDNDLELHNLGKEAAIAGLASLVEGGSIWLVVCLIPAAQRPVAFRALIIPLLAVGLIYRVAHLVNWRNGDVLYLMLFQFAVSYVVVFLLTGHFGVALFGLLVFGIVLAVIASFAKSL